MNNLSLPTIMSVLENLLPTIVFILVVVIPGFHALIALRTLLKFIRYIQEPKHFFEVIPPASGAINASATKELFKILHGIRLGRSSFDVLLGYYPRLSLEIMATKQTGIRYIIGAPLRLKDTVHQELKSYDIDAKISATDDPYKNIASSKSTIVSEYRLRRHFALPLATKDGLDTHDPMAYLTGAMSELEENETVIYQLVLIPKLFPEADSIARQILTNSNVLSHLMHEKCTIGSGFLSGINSILFSILDSIGGFSSHTSGDILGYERTNTGITKHRQEVALKLKPERVLSSFEQEVVMAVQEKVLEPLFNTSLRTVVVSSNRKKAVSRAQNLRTSLSSFSTSQYQSIVRKRVLNRTLQRTLGIWSQKHRLPALVKQSSLILSASEVSSLFHFPYAGSNKTENIVKSLSRSLPAPLSLKNNPLLDVLIGVNEYHGIHTPIGLTAQERERHMFVIGGTGNGKTTMLQYMIMQDIKNGKGVAILDPHGDMSQEIASRIPTERIKDVIYFNPDDLSYPIGMNLLELDEKLEGDDLLREKDLITESVVSIFRKIFSEDDSGGHRVEYILRNTTQTALTIKDATLFTIYDLLNDAGYRRRIVTKLTDKNLQNFWRNEFGKAGSFQQVKMAAGITAKVGRFLFSASAKRILEQPKSTINFDTIMDEGRILICNFSKGMIGEDTSELLGTAVLAKLQLASLRRARKAQSERRPFYLYVDEFQNFATVSFVEMLSESRKYKLFLTMAEQSTSQQENKDMINVILANVGTVVTFRTGNPADEELLLPLFNPYMGQGEIMNLPSFHFYMRLAAIYSQESLSGKTLLLSANENKSMKTIEASSRKFYANKIVANRAEDSQSDRSTGCGYSCDQTLNPIV